MPHVDGLSCWWLSLWLQNVCRAQMKPTSEFSKRTSHQVLQVWLGASSSTQPCHAGKCVWVFSSPSCLFEDICTWFGFLVCSKAALISKAKTYCTGAINFLQMPLQRPHGNFQMNNFIIKQKEVKVQSPQSLLSLLGSIAQPDKKWLQEQTGLWKIID